MPANHEVAHISAGHCHSCAALCSCAMRWCTAVQGSVRARDGRKQEQSSEVEGRCEAQSCMHCVFVSDLRKNPSYKPSPGIEPIPKLGLTEQSIDLDLRILE